MNSNPIEDILIDHTPKKEKKKGRGMLWILIFLFVVGLILGAGYFYYQRTNIIGNKENFFEGFKNTKLGFYTTNNVIEQMGQNFLDVNSEVITNVKLTNSLELPEKLQGIDLAKLVFDIKTRNSVRLNTANTDVTVSYSDNETSLPSVSFSILVIGFNSQSLISLKAKLIIGVVACTPQALLP